MVGDTVAAMQELGLPSPPPKPEKRDVGDKKGSAIIPVLLPADLLVVCFLIAVVIQQSAEGRITKAVLACLDVARKMILDARICGYGDRKVIPTGEAAKREVF